MFMFVAVRGYSSPTHLQRLGFGLCPCQLLVVTMCVRDGVVGVEHCDGFRLAGGAYHIAPVSSPELAQPPSLAAVAHG